MSWLNLVECAKDGGRPSVRFLLLRIISHSSIPHSYVLWIFGFLCMHLFRFNPLTIDPAGFDFYKDPHSLFQTLNEILRLINNNGKWNKMWPLALF